jgi:hypothetical protein
MIHLFYTNQEAFYFGLHSQNLALLKKQITVVGRTSMLEKSMFQALVRPHALAFCTLGLFFLLSPKGWSQSTFPNSGFFNSPGGNPFAPPQFDSSGMSFSPGTTVWGSSGTSESTVENVQFDMRADPGSEKDCPLVMQVSDDNVRDEEGKPHPTLVSGDAPLNWLAEGFRLEKTTQQNAIWRGYLHAKYRSCKGTAVMKSRGADSIQPEKSYLNLTFKNGILHFHIDLTKVTGGKAILLEVGVVRGEPAWRWKLTQTVSKSASL